ncbi:actinodin3 [Ictalurus furcatus]|uniref:actinodin3 n=1 Tax=Ictalurus furcatus TaxID=66913 RepID=UPI002350FF59|nr:actinodin3 [Ictalurus furcatus]
MKQIKYILISESGQSVSIDSFEAHNFLVRSRRSAEPKWYHKDPDFQSYYGYYSSIGHVEGLYEIDKIRILYQQMRHLEQKYGADASKYQNIVGLQIPKTTSPPPTTKPPPLPTTHPSVPSLSQSDVIYLCNPKDPLCKPRIVYVPTGAVVIPCDPRYHPSCKLSTPTEGPSEAAELHSTTHPPVPKSPSIIKGMENDCDPYWDPDCLIENLPRPVKLSDPPLSNLPSKSLLVNRAEKENEKDHLASSSEDKRTLDASYLLNEPSDYYRDLYDPYQYVNPAPGPQ